MKQPTIQEREHRYRTIFETAAVSIWEEDFSQCKLAIDKLKAGGVRDFRQYLTVNPLFAIEALQNVKVVDVNQQSLKLFGARNKEELMFSLDRVFLPETLAVFKEELIAIAEGSNYFESEAMVRTLQGQKLNILVTISFPETNSLFDRVLVSLIDITERKRMEEELRMSEERFRTMADSAPVLIWISGTDKLCTWFNRKWLEFVGRTMEQEVGNGWTENVHPGDFDRCLRTYVTSFDARESFNMEYRLRRYDGAWRWILDNGIPNYGPNEEFVGYIGSCIDITERREAEANYRELFEKANDAIYIHELETGRVLDVNHRATEISGFTKEEIINGNPADFMAGTPGNSVDDAMRHLQRAATEGRQTFEWHARHKKGSLFWVEVTLYRAKIAGKERILAFFHEIESQKQAQEKLKASELRYRSLIEQATDGIFISDEKGNYEDANQSACKMLGYSRDELLKMNVQKVLLPEEAKNNPPRFEELLAGKTILSTRNLKRKDGSVFPVEINAKMLSNGRMLGMVRDITERKEAEEKLKASEEKFRNLTETAFDAIILMDEGGKIVFWNRGAELIFGYKAEEAILKPLTMIMPEKYRQRHVHGIERYRRTGENRVIGKVVELEGMHKNGDIFPIEISITCWEANNKKLFSGIIRDVTERKKVEEKIQKVNEELEQKVTDRTAELKSNIKQLKESEEKFQKAFQASAAGITITRLPDDTYLEVNDAFVRMIGYSREELIGHSSQELGLVVSLIKRDEVLQQIRELGSAKNFEMTVRSKSGDTLEVLTSVETILLGVEKYAINIVYDITERKKAEEQLETVNKELESFSYSVSHDLRAPLRSILGYSKILEEDYSEKLDRHGRQTLATIQQNAGKMNSLIDDLLEFAKLGKKELEKSEVNSKALIDGIIGELGSSLKHNAAIKLSDLPFVYGDPALLAQVWTNLIANAIKYSSKKERPVIEIGSIEKDNEIVYYVKDNGVGFDMQYLDKLFGVFQRLHVANDFEGTGVGLAIVQKIIDKHKGRIWAEGRVNEGAIFYFSLPKK